MHDVLTFLGGGAVGSLITIFVSGRRDKERRFRVVMRRLNGWKAEIELAKDIDACYFQTVRRFVEDLEEVKELLSTNDQFWNLSRRLKGLKKEDLHDPQKDPRKVVLAAINDFAVFLTTHKSRGRISKAFYAFMLFLDQHI